MFTKEQNNILNSFRVEDLENPITANSIAESMDNKKGYWVILKEIVGDTLAYPGDFKKAKEIYESQAEVPEHDCHAGPESGCNVCPQKEFVEEELID